VLLTAVFYISSPADSQEYSAFEEDSVFWSTVTSRTDRKVLYQRLCWVRVPVPIFPPVTITCNNNNVGYYVVSLSWQLLKYFQWHTYIFAMANVYVVTIKYILCEKFLMNSTCSYLCYSLSLLWSAGTSSWSLLWPLTNSTFLEITRPRGCCLLGQTGGHPSAVMKLSKWQCWFDSGVPCVFAVICMCSLPK